MEVVRRGRGSAAASRNIWWPAVGLRDVELGLAQRPLERREQVRDRLRVVPDVRAGAVAAAAGVAAALPRPEPSVVLAQDGRRLRGSRGWPRPPRSPPAAASCRAGSRGSAARACAGRGTRGASARPARRGWRSGRRTRRGKSPCRDRPRRRPDPCRCAGGSSGTYQASFTRIVRDAPGSSVTGTNRRSARRRLRPR